VVLVEVGSEVAVGSVPNPTNPVNFGGGAYTAGDEQMREAESKQPTSSVSRGGAAARERFGNPRILHNICRSDKRYNNGNVEHEQSGGKNSVVCLSERSRGYFLGGI